VVDQVLLSAGLGNIEDCVKLATRQGLGIEVMAFAYPDVLDGNWQDILEFYKQLLRPVPGRLSMHGPFMDMAPGSPDKQIKVICMKRYEHAIRIADVLGVGLVVFHANFIASIHNIEYRSGWQQRNIDFWGELAYYAYQYGITIAVENMWEFDPYIIGDVLKAVDHPNLRACLDVGHAHLFSEVPFDEWLKAMEPWLVHIHANNNNGVIDVHRGLADGVLDYPHILNQLRSMTMPPTITLEMDHVADMKASLEFLELPEPSDTNEWPMVQA